MRKYRKEQEGALRQKKRKGFLNDWYPVLQKPEKILYRVLILFSVDIPALTMISMKKLKKLLLWEIWELMQPIILSKI